MRSCRTEHLSDAIPVLASLGWRREGAYVNGLMADVIALADRKSEAITLLDERLLTSASSGVCGIQRKDPMQEGRGVGDWPGCRYVAEEQKFRYAIDIAVKQSAKQFELQACSGLARLWLQRSRPADARILLEPVLAWFTEGLTLPDLQDGPVAGVVEIGGGVISGLCNEPDSAVRRRWRLHHGSA